MQHILVGGKSRIGRRMLRTCAFSVGMILIFSMATLAGQTSMNRGEATQMSTKPIEQVLKEHTDDLMSLPGVVGTGQGLCSGQPCIKVFVGRKTGTVEQKIPRNLEGYPVVIEETGRFKSLGDTRQ